MKKKKLLKGLLVSAFAVCLTLGFAACGDLLSKKEDPETPEGEEPTKYDITYSAGVGTGTAVKKGSYAADATFTVATADEFNFTYTNNGADYYITKWNDGEKDVEFGSTYTMPAHNVTLTAQWEPVPTTFSVTYKAGVGEGDDEIGGTYAEAAKFAVAAPNEFGYTYSVGNVDYYISGWSDGTTVTPIGSEYTMPDHDVTLTAQWEVDDRDEVYVTYYDYDGTTVVYEETLHEGDASLYTAAPDATEFPYTGNYSAFEGWDKSAFTAHYVTEDKSVYGKWQYTQSDDSYFTFTAIDDNAAYTVSLNPDAGEIEGGGALYLPIIHEGKPVEGITAGTNAETAAFGGLNAATVVIPDTYDAIAAYAFANNEHITAVQIGKTGGTRAQGKKLDIADHAFYTMSLLTTFNSATEGAIVIPATTTSIGDYAFSQVKATSFAAEANSALETIGQQAFAGATAASKYGTITTISIPDSVTEIKTKAFAYNPISSLTFGTCEGVLTVGESAFDGSTAADGFNTATTLTLPADINIGKAAFKNWRALTTLTFRTAPDAATSSFTVGESAFENAYVLTSLAIPNGATAIGKKAFVNAKELTSLTIPATVQTINESAFDTAEKLLTLTLPEGVTTIGKKAFYATRALTSVTIPTTVTSIADEAFNGSHNLASVTFTPGGSTGLTIGKQAFAATSVVGISSKVEDKLTSFEFPARTTSIGSGVFFKREFLSSITFAEPAEGEPTLDLTFAAGALSSLVSGTGSHDTSTNTPSSYVHPVIPVTSLVIPARTTSIGVKAFAGLFELTSLVFEDGIRATEIPDYTVWGSYKLQTLTIPEGIQTIKQYAFGLPNGAPDGTSNDHVPTYKYKKLTPIEGGTGYQSEDATMDNAYNTTLKTLVIPSTVKTIGIYNFDNLVALEELRFADLGEDAASGGAQMDIGASCFGINMVNGTIDATVKAKLAELSVYIGSSVKKIQNNFGNHTKLKSLTFSDKSGLTEVGTKVFGYCTDPTITTVELPASLTTIGDNSFIGLSSLTSYTVASGSANFEAEEGVLYTKAAEPAAQRTIVRYPGSKAEATFDLHDAIVGKFGFAGNASIQTLNIGENVTLDDSAFKLASGLKTLNINNQPTYASGAKYFFAECYNLETVTIASGVTTLGAYMFQMSAHPGGTDDQSIDAQTAFTTINGLENITTYAERAFYHCSNLNFGTNFKLNDAVTELPQYVFDYCKNLTKIDLNNATTIANYAFAYTGLTEIDLTDVTSIGTFAFQATALTSVTWPDAIGTIPNSCFANCASLTKLIIPSETLVNLNNVNALNNTPLKTAGSSARIVVPDSLVTQYKAATNWSTTPIKDFIVGSTEYTITFAKADDLKGAASATIPEKAATDYKYATYTLPAANETGIDENYYLAWIIGEEEYLPGATITLDGAETSLTATLTAVKYATVTFSWGEGVTDAVGNPPESLKVKHGTIADPNTLPQRPGYAFVGWKKRGAEGLWNFETDVVDGDITLDVVWGKEIDVTFSWGDGVTDVTGKLPEATKGYQGLVVADPDVTPTREDYVFKGWKKSGAADTELWNFDEDTIPLDAQNIQFVAVWEADEEA